MAKKQNSKLIYVKRRRFRKLSRESNINIDIYMRRKFFSYLSHMNESNYVPVNIYISSDDYKVFLGVKDALVPLLNEAYLIKQDRYSKEPIKGSWYQEFLAYVRSIGGSPNTKEKIKILEDAFELKTVGVAQANIDNTKASAVAVLIDSLSGTKEAIVQIGSLVVLKYSNENGESVIQVISLTQKQLKILYENPQLSKNVEAFLERFVLREDNQIQRVENK